MLRNNHNCCEPRGLQAHLAWTLLRFGHTVVLTNIANFEITRTQDTTFSTVMTAIVHMIQEAATEMSRFAEKPVL